ncbi:hypothetical protein Tco_1354623 [Tanacetum coccineum]
MAIRPPHSKVVQDVNHKKFSNEDIIVIEDDHDVIHDNNSSYLALSASLNDLDYATLNIDGQSTDVEAPPDIIDVDKDDDFIDDEDDIPRDLADFDNEVLANDDDDDDVDVVYSSVGGRKAIRGGRGGDRQGTRKETRKIGLNKVTDEYGPLKIRFEFNDKGTMLHLSENSARWSNLIGELVREYPMYYPSWHKIEEEKKARVLGRLMQHFDLTPRIRSKLWPKIKKGIGSTYGQEEMLWLRDLGANTPTGVPYTEDQIMAMVRKGKRRGHIPGVGRVLAEQGRDAISINEPRGTYTDVDVDELKEEAKRTRRELELRRRVIRSDDRMSQMYKQLESQHELGGGSRSDGGGAGDEDADGDEEI